MPKSRDDLFALLDSLSIGHTTTEHDAVFTVEEGAAIKAQLPGGHTKNLFLKDKAGRLFLVCALGSTQISVNKLHRELDCKRLRDETCVWGAVRGYAGCVPSLC